MTRSMRFAAFSLFVVAGCSLATDFERFHTSEQTGRTDAGDAAPDGGGDGDKPGGDGDLDGAVQAEGQIDVQLAEGSLGTVTSEPGGIDCAGDCSEVYKTGTEVVLTAHPDATGAFVGWGGACAGKAEGLTCTLVAGEPLTVTASFTADWFGLTVSRLGSGTGSVSSTDEMLRCDGAPDEICNARYPRGATVSLTATPSPDGSTFSGWGGSCAGAGACQLEVSSDKVVNAVFDSAGQASLIVSKAGNGNGVVTSDDAVGDAPPRINCGTQCAASYAVADNTAVMLSAVADGSSDFVGFAGDCVSQAVVEGQPATCLAMMGAVSRVTATFALKKRSLSIAWSGDGEGAVHLTEPKELSCTKPNACSDSFDHGSMLHMEAVPAEGSTFKQWSLGTCGTATTCEFPIVSNTVVFATFEINEFQFNAGTTGSGAAVCTVDGVTSECPSPGKYKFGTQVVINAAPAPGNQLDAWQGDCAGQAATGPCTLTISKDTSVVAAFKKKSYQVTVKFDDTGGHGSVTGDASCSDSQGTCSVSVQHDGAFQISAVAAADSDFVAFTGDCNGTVCSIAKVEGDLTITASFTLKAAPTKTLVVANAGGGTVVSSPSGISCGNGGSCVATFNVNTPVTLTGTPFTGYNAPVFSGGCAGSTCDLTMDDAKSVTVTFSPQSFALNASVTGPGGITLKGMSGLDCNDGDPDGPDCSESLPFDSKVTLVATPTSAGTFSGWTGACQDQLGSECQITIGQSNTVGATFALKTFKLSVKLAGEGLAPGSLVTGNGIDCGVSGNGCIVELSALTAVTLTANPPVWAAVTSTDGPCAAQGAICAFTLTQDTAVVFTINPKAALVFVTNDLFPATLNTNPKDLKGAARADDQCTALAGTVAGLSGRWVAWLSDSRTGPADRMKWLKPETPVMMLNGEYAMQRGYGAVALGGALTKPIMITETGKSLRLPLLGTAIPVWTGTLRSGLPIPEDRNFCGDWSSAIGTLSYGIGDAYDGTDKAGPKSKNWTHSADYDDSKTPLPFVLITTPCGQSARLYCFRDWSKDFKP